MAIENRDYRVKAIVYEKASHALGAEMSNNMRKMIKMVMPTEKLYPKECERARKDSIQQMLEFLRAW